MLKAVSFIFVFMYCSGVCLAEEDWQEDLRQAYVASNYGKVHEIASKHSKDIFDGESPDLKFIAGTTLFDDAVLGKTAKDALTQILDKVGEEDRAVIEALLNGEDEEES